VTKQPKQLPLLGRTPPRREGGQYLVPVTEPPGGGLMGDSSLATALHWFQDEMRRKGLAPNTRRTYAKAVSLLVRYLGKERPLNRISPDDLRRFQAWVMENARSPKTAEVKLTAVRRFFLDLYEAGVLPNNAAADVYPTKATPAPPVILNRAQEEAVRRAASEMITQPEGDSLVPCLLVTLMLDMGLRMGEVERLIVDDVDLDDLLRPRVYVRYAERRHRAKRRTVHGPPALADLVRRYLELHPPPDGEERLLPFSRRRLQHIIERIGREADLRRRLTPNTLRWTYIARSLLAGIPPEEVQRAAGLSALGWQDAVRRLQDALQTRFVFASEGR